VGSSSVSSGGGQDAPYWPFFLTVSCSC
jgi:hypothetical protein